jgi:cysteine desulfurase
MERAVAEGPGVVSMMWVNNETGIVLPVPAAAERLAGADAVLHTDAVQAVGKLPVRVDEVPVDLLTITGHKIRGPKGAGLLFVRSGTELSPFLHGGGQERGLRPGTEDVAGAVGLALALRLAVEEREAEAERLRALRDGLEAALTARVPGARVNGGEAPRAPHVASLGFPAVDGRALLMALDLEGVAVSGGSACDSGAQKGSHVIAALYGDADRHAIVRFSLGGSTTLADVERAADLTTAVIERMRAGGRAAEASA